VSRKHRYRKEIRLFRRVVKAVYDSESQAESGANTYTQLIARVAGLYPRLADRELERRLRNETGNLSATNSYLHLEPISKGPALVPVMDMKWDFTGEAPLMQLRLMLFLSHDDRIRSIGFRFESPDANGAMHNYPHVQLISRLEVMSKRSASDAGMSAANDIPWLPESQPALPLPTSTPVGLLLCALLSLYGPNYLKRMQQELQSDIFKDECKRIGLS